MPEILFIRNSTLYLSIKSLKQMENFISELIGTAIIILLGNGVVANVVLKDTKGHGGGLIAITFGWAIAVFIGVIVASKSGAHLNPAVTIAMLMDGNITVDQLFSYIGGQLIGAIIGAILVYLIYKNHFNATPEQDLKQACFCTSPTRKDTLTNLISEIIGTFVLIFAILNIPSATNDLGGLNPLPVALIVLSIGLSLGGTTGYAINPARDLGPRIAHAILPIKGKGGNNWEYAWIPIVGPVVGSIFAVLLHHAVN